jgi:hypothetical protein
MYIVTGPSGTSDLKEGAFVHALPFSISQRKWHLLNNLLKLKLCKT